jgi:hypothetical protein
LVRSYSRVLSQSEVFQPPSPHLPLCPLSPLSSGRLSRGDMLAFAESYRRKFLSLDNNKLRTPPLIRPIVPPRKSPTTKNYNYSSPSLHLPSHSFSPSPSLSSPTHPIDVMAPIKDERAQLLPIEQSKLFLSSSSSFLPSPPTQTNLSESPLTFGKKSSYGLFLPHNYQTIAPSGPLSLQVPSQNLVKKKNHHDRTDEDYSEVL